MIGYYEVLAQNIQSTLLVRQVGKNLLDVWNEPEGDSLKGHIIFLGVIPFLIPCLSHQQAMKGISVALPF